MSSIFTRIVKGEIPAHKIAENDKYLAMLDIRPVNPGHTLVIPKEEIDYFFDLNDAQMSEIMVFAKKVAAALKKAVPCKKIGVIVAGLEVPHAHVHLIPIIASLSELSFARAKPTGNEELAAMASKIKSHL